MKFDIGMLKVSIEQLEQAKVIVAGDPMFDLYHFGQVLRISPEAPVPVFEELRNEQREGGAANVVANLASLGARVATLYPSGPWIEKHRYMVGHQQMFRVDLEQHYEALIPTPHAAELIAAADVLVLSDYAKGALGPASCKALIEMAIAASTVVIVDPKGPFWGKYDGAHILCPNTLELLEWRGADMRSIAQWNLPFDLVLKCGARGLRVHERMELTEERMTQIPATARQVFDVTGAGDTVVAVLAAAIAVHCPLREAAYLANAAAGLVVGKVGTSTVTREELLEELAHVLSTSGGSIDV